MNMSNYNNLGLFQKTRAMWGSSENPHKQLYFIESC